MRELLYLTHRMPYPPNKGDKIRSFHLLKYLSQYYRVHLGTFIDDEADWQHVDAVKAYCGETHFAKLNPAISRLCSLSGLLTGRALTLPYYQNADLQHWVDNLLASGSIQHVLIFSSAMAQYVQHIDDARRVIDFVDIDSDKWNQYAQSKHWPLSWLYRREGRLLLDYEREVALQFDASLFVSPAEAELFQQLAPESASKTSYFSNGVDADYFSPERVYPKPYSDHEQALVFTGAMDYWPNVDAVRWFSEEIFPAIFAKFPQARFYIVGSRPNPAVQELAKLPGVVVTGTVADIRPYLAHARLAVAPLRIARGLQNKVLEAMAMARVVVASPQAAEGIQATSGTEFYIADDNQEYIQIISALLADQADHMIASAARGRILKDYDWNNNLMQVETLLAETSESWAAKKLKLAINHKEIQQ